MAFPVSWPPRPSSGVKSLRFYVTGTSTANFADNGFMFADDAGANPYLVTPVVPAGGEDINAAAGTSANSGSPMGGGRNRLDADPDPKNRVLPPPLPQIWASHIKITNTGGSALEVTFEGTVVQGFVPASSSVIYDGRYESGIAVRGSGGTGTFHIEAW